MWILMELDTEPDPLLFFLEQKTKELKDEFDQGSWADVCCVVFKRVIQGLRRLTNYIQRVQLQMYTHEKGGILLNLHWSEETDHFFKSVRITSNQILHTCCNRVISAMNERSTKKHQEERGLTNNVILTLVHLFYGVCSGFVVTDETQKLIQETLNSVVN